MQFSKIKFNQETTEYIAPTWQEMSRLTFAIAKKIIKQQQQCDRIITLAKGGWPLTRSLVDFLAVDQVASIGVKFYAGINNRLDQPIVYQDIPVSIQDESILLFDDVADTGESLIFVKNYLKTKGVKKVTTASLFYKPHSKLIPDYYGASTNAWIIFPYDVAEMIRVLGKKWLDSGIKPAEMLRRWQKLGFDQEIINFYSHSVVPGGLEVKS